MTLRGFLEKIPGQKTFFCLSIFNIKYARLFRIMTCLYFRKDPSKWDSLSRFIFTIGERQEDWQVTWNVKLRVCLTSLKNTTRIHTRFDYEIRIHESFGLVKKGNRIFHLLRFSWIDFPSSMKSKYKELIAIRTNIFILDKNRCILLQMFLIWNLWFNVV